jgi:hypothetical protein
MMKTKDGEWFLRGCFKRFTGFGPNGEPQFTGQEGEDSSYTR